MKMTNMKQEAPKPSDCCPIRSDAPAYPYGLKIRLEEADLKKLGIKELPEVGHKMKVEIMVEVCEMSYSETSLYGENRCLGLQITDMALGMKHNGSDKDEKATY